jgi:hypothetical protein
VTPLRILREEERQVTLNAEPLSPVGGKHVVQPTSDRAVAPVSTYNQLHSVRYKHGWPGLFAGENQTKAIQRALVELNGSGLKVAAAVTDRWSFWKRLGCVLLAIITLGFVVRAPNVLLVLEPMK